MTQIDRIVKNLSENNKGAGITAAKLAKLAKVSTETVYKRVSDLRREGFTIYSNKRDVKGKRVVHYRLAA